MKYLTITTALLACILAPILGICEETKAVKKPGIKTLQLVSEQDDIIPGKEFSIGLFIQHLPEYHTYWKAPGIVGVPTTITWELPEGFSAADIEWPVPEVTKMAAYTCYGYEQDVCLLSRITVPEKIEAESVTFKARVAFMCCAKTCHPGWHDFEMTFPISKGKTAKVDRKWAKQFSEIRKKTPEKVPVEWLIQANETEKEIQLTLALEKSTFSKGNVYCFCEDNRINSDVLQTVERSKDKKSLSLILEKSGFGPEDLKYFSGLLYHPEGWPGVSSKWILVKVPLSSGS